MNNLRTLFFLAILSLYHLNANSQSSNDISRIALFPQQNEIRNTLNLSGIWRFKKDSLEVGEKENWQNGLTAYRSIAVPGSWNEQFTDSRDYLGVVWYEKETYVPSAWRGQRIFIRVGSATYAAKVWINGQLVGKHEGGNLPFAFEIGSYLKWGSSNRISIQVENLLKPTRVPTGDVKGGPFTNFPKSNYDFFPYSGLHRDIWLYSLPSIASIKDITVKTGFSATTGSVEVKIETEGKAIKGNAIVSGNGKRYEVPLPLELDALHKAYNKPIIITEFGADTYPGMHTEQSEMFTEEFQVEFLKAYLDFADQKDYIAGMHVWAFSDFKTSQGIIRFGGVNYKGVFTRDRKPKTAAYYLRSRWNK